MNLHALALVPPAFFVVLRLMDYISVAWLPQHYVFDPVKLKDIAHEAIVSLDIDAPAAAIMDKVYELLRQEYGPYIADVAPEHWVFNNAGNAMGSMLVLHASLSEYLIFFGTAVGTEGHTGTHFADDYFTILYGHQYAALPNATIAEHYRAGDQHHLPYRLNKQYRMPAGSWALELAQGFIPTMLPFGMIEVATSTFDVGTLLKTIRISATHIIGNLLRGKI